MYWGRYQCVMQLLLEVPSCAEQNPLFKRLDQPKVSPLLTPGMPLRLAEHNQPPQSAPRLGADTEAVLVDVLSLSSAEFGRLHDQGLVRCAWMAGKGAATSSSQTTMCGFRQRASMTEKCKP